MLLNNSNKYVQSELAQVLLRFFYLSGQCQGLTSHMQTDLYFKVVLNDHIYTLHYCSHIKAGLDRNLKWLRPQGKLIDRWSRDFNTALYYDESFGADIQYSLTYFMTNRL